VRAQDGPPVGRQHRRVQGSSPQEDDVDGCSLERFLVLFSHIARVFRAVERVLQKVMALEQGSGYLCSGLAAPRDLLQCRSACVEDLDSALDGWMHWGLEAFVDSCLRTE